jgi:hypothetical protein
MDGGFPKCGGQKGVQQSLSAQRESLDPGEELPSRGVPGEHMDDLPGSPPLLGQLTCGGHVERLCETAAIGHDMNELSQHLRRDGDQVAVRKQPCQCISCGACSACSVTSAATRNPVSSPWIMSGLQASRQAGRPRP